MRRWAIAAVIIILTGTLMARYYRRELLSRDSLMSGVGPTPKATYELTLVSAHGYATDTPYHRVEGEIKNISNRPIQRVDAIVTWYDNEGKFLVKDRDVIDRQITPGQTAHFRTDTKSDPAMSKYSVNLRYSVETLMVGRILNMEQPWPRFHLRPQH
jgi:hypothetical protein